jgi:hypothetical protein
MSVDPTESTKVPTLVGLVQDVTGVIINKMTHTDRYLMSLVDKQWHEYFNSQLYKLKHYYDIVEILKSGNILMYLYNDNFYNFSKQTYPLLNIYSFASYSNNIEFLKILFRIITIKIYDKTDAFEGAFYNESYDMINFIFKITGNVDPSLALFGACSKGNIPFIKLCLEKYGNVLQPLALMGAYHLGNSDVIDLIEKRIDKTYEYSYATYKLRGAISGNHIELVKSILKNNACEPWEYRHLAIINDNTEIFKLLTQSISLHDLSTIGQLNRIKTLKFIIAEYELTKNQLKSCYLQALRYNSTDVMIYINEYVFNKYGFKF